jgi:YVTN family beta-propeller protein
MTSYHRRSLPEIFQFFLVVLLPAWPISVLSQTVAATVSAGTAPETVAVNKMTNKIYVANFLSHSVTVIDGTTNSTTTVQTGLRPRAMAVNEATNKIYVANVGDVPLGGSDRGGVTVIDGVTNLTTTVIDPNANGPTAVAVNSGTNTIYVANRWTGNVTVIDGTGGSILTVVDPNANGMQSVAVAVNPVTDKIYVVNNNQFNTTVGSTTVINGSNNSTTTVRDPNAASPVAVAVNSATNKIYVANQGDYPGSNHGNITLIDGTTNSVTTLTDSNMLAPQAVAVNQTTDKIYVANGNDLAQTGIGGVTVIDGMTNAISTVTDPNAMFPHAVTVDSVTDMIYVANEGCFPENLCRNPGSVTVINGATNSTATIINPKAQNPEAIAVRPTNDQVYVANVGSGNLTVIDGAGVPTTQTLAVLMAGSGSGTVTSNPAGIDCGTSSCIASFAVGTPVSLSASAASGSQFSGWSGPCSGKGACSLMTNVDQFVTATFNDSTGPVQIAVPSVVGQIQAAASIALTGAGLVVGTVTQQSSSTVASGYVISESPAAGTNVASGYAVNLVVSTGGSSGGGGGIDTLTLAVLLSSLIVALRRDATRSAKECV